MQSKSKIENSIPAVNSSIRPKAHGAKKGRFTSRPSYDTLHPLHSTVYSWYLYYVLRTLRKKDPALIRTMKMPRCTR